MKRIGYIDVMKGIAILSVLVGHYIALRSVGTAIWSFHMPLFVFISGYFYKQQEFRGLLKRNLKNYMFPYVIVWGGVLLSELIVYSVFNHLSSEPMLLSDAFIRRIISGFYGLASNSTLHKPDFVIKIGVIWFLNALFIGEIMLFFVLKIQKITNQIISVAGIIVIACIQTACICIPFGINYGCAFLGWLYMGYIFRKHNLFDKIDGSIIVKAIAVVIWLIVIVLEYLTNNSFNIIHLSFPLYGVEIIGAFFGILSIRWLSVWIENNLQRLAEVLMKLGRNTIWILCIHAIDIELWNYASGFVPVPKMLMGLIRIALDIILAMHIKHMVLGFRNRKLRRTCI